MLANENMYKLNVLETPNSLSAIASVLISKQACESWQLLPTVIYKSYTGQKNGSICGLGVLF